MPPQHHVPAERWFWIPADCRRLMDLSYIDNNNDNISIDDRFQLFFISHFVLFEGNNQQMNQCNCQLLMCLSLGGAMFCSGAPSVMSWLICWHDTWCHPVMCPYGHRIRTQTSCLSVRVSFTQSRLWFYWLVCCVRSSALLINIQQETLINDFERTDLFMFSSFLRTTCCQCLTLCL